MAAPLTALENYLGVASRLNRDSPANARSIAEMNSPDPDRITLDTLGKLQRHGHGIGGY
jgi:hypothetical protein